MRARGQITVYLSLILLCVLGLLCGLLESARMAGARCYLQMAAYSSLDSVMSQYHRPMWDQYRILGVEYVEQEDLETEMRRYLRYYEDTPNWYPMEAEQVEARQVMNLTDGNGKYLEQEILDFMKYGVWAQGQDWEIANEFEKAVREAESVNQISEMMEDQTKAAWKLEETLENLEKCLDKQAECYGQAGTALGKGDGSSFQRAAKRLRKYLERTPKLVEEYEKQADTLGRKIEEVKKRYEEEREDISDTVQQAMLEELERYESYTSKDGERRNEVEGLSGQALQQRDLVSEVMEEAEGIEEMIQSWEPESEEDELDEDALWAPVRRHFSEYEMLILSCRSGSEDKETEGILERIRRAVDSGILQLVLPEGTVVSEGILSSSGLPSGTGSVRGGKGEDWGKTPRGVETILDRVLMAEYCGAFFTNFCSEEEKEFQYEMEYLLFGNPIDGTNLTDSVYRLLAVREGLNLVAILTDPEKRREAETLAASIVGVSGFLPLVGITAFFIMGVWALGESLMDIKTLLADGKVPLLKGREDWKLSLAGLLELGRTGKVLQEEGENGLGYPEYLKLFLILLSMDELDYRIMDLIQVNLARKESGFRIDRCTCGVNMSVEVCGKHVFFSLGLLKGLLGGEAGTYQYGTIVEKCY